MIFFFLFIGRCFRVEYLGKWYGFQNFSVQDWIGERNQDFRWSQKNVHDAWRNWRERFVAVWRTLGCWWAHRWACSCGRKSVRWPPLPKWTFQQGPFCCLFVYVHFSHYSNKQIRLCFFWTKQKRKLREEFYCNNLSILWKQVLEILFCSGRRHVADVQDLRGRTNVLIVFAVSYSETM